MIVLNSVNKTLWAELDDVPNTPLEVVTSFVDITHVGNQENSHHHAQLSRLSGALAVSICDAPPANTERVIMNVSIFSFDNPDALMLRVFFKDDSQEYTIGRSLMSNDEGLHYEHGAGWYRRTAAGMRL